MHTKIRIPSTMLANVEERNQGSRSFEIPTRAERNDLWPGDLVKLVFEGLGERLWVRVLTRNDDDGDDFLPFLGIIESEPAFSSLDTPVHKGDNLNSLACCNPRRETTMGLKRNSKTNMQY